MSNDRTATVPGKGDAKGKNVPTNGKTTETDKPIAPSATASTTNGAAESERMVRLKLTEIKVDWKINIRNGGEEIKRDDPKVIELAESIKTEGLLENLVVWERITPPPKGAAEGVLGKVEYLLAAGFKRYLALSILGHVHADCRPTRGEKKDILLKNGAENLVRDDLAIFDVAARCSDLKKEFGMSGAEIGRAWKLEKSTVNNYIRVYENLHPKILAHWKKLDENFDDMRRIAALPMEEQMAAFKQLRELREGSGEGGKDDDEENEETPLKLPPMLRRPEVENHVQYSLAKMEEIKVGSTWVAINEDHVAGARAYARWMLNRKKPTFRTGAVEEE